MQYTQLFSHLKQCFGTEQKKVKIPNSNIEIQWHPFTATPRFSIPSLANCPNALSSLPDDKIPENRIFSYPVFVPETRGKLSDPLLLLHGLNERSWEKYLPWAYRLCESTGRPVVLFPIAFHMNRAPKDWGNPRAMLPVLKQQQSKKFPNATFVNIALSERLRNNPLRFFVSGHQSACDIEHLCAAIRDGKHPLFRKGSRIDFFSYSIGAFLSQILFLANPRGLFSHSRLFMFCGGSVFSRMDGNSRMIMDSKAFDLLLDYYVFALSPKLQESDPFARFLTQTPMGKAFRAMLDDSQLKAYRETAFRKIGKQMHAIALEQDKVIPAPSIVHTLCSWDPAMKNTVEIRNFPFPCSHETPFPIGNTQISPLVDQCFEEVFQQAASFLTP